MKQEADLKKIEVENENARYRDDRTMALFKQFVERQEERVSLIVSCAAKSGLIAVSVYRRKKVKSPTSSVLN